MTGGGQTQYPNKLAAVPFLRRVLVDTGANEVSRPHHPDWWNETIMKLSLIHISEPTRLDVI
eukprot:11711493-Prorocentrum_lima.AAC.1